MRKIVTLCLAALALACAEEVIKKPENLIERSKMVAIYYDMALISSVEAVSPSIIKNTGVETLPYIYKKYGIDSTLFAESDRYYASIPLEYQLMYEEVEGRLEAEKKQLEDLRDQRADSLKQANQKRTDSLKKVKENLVKPVLVKEDGNNAQ